MASVIFAAIILSLWVCTTNASLHAVGECETPSDPEHGWVDIVYNAAVKQMAVYSCDPGYAVIGRNTMTCRNGHWNRKRHPACTFVDCEAPEGIENGQVRYTSTEYNGKAVYSCDPCYKLQGVSNRVCKQSGVWSKDPPKCVRQECTPVVMTQGLQVNSESRNPPYCGDTIKVQCKPGYRLEGAETAYCLQGGIYVWLGDVARCVRV